MAIETTPPVLRSLRKLLEIVHPELKEDDRIKLAIDLYDAGAFELNPRTQRLSVLRADYIKAASPKLFRVVREDVRPLPDGASEMARVENAARRERATGEVRTQAPTEADARRERVIAAGGLPAGTEDERLAKALARERAYYQASNGRSDEE